jgi:hypothetical protein
VCPINTIQRVINPLKTHFILCGRFYVTFAWI